jgi:hypothetical protein
MDAVHLQHARMHDGGDIDHREGDMRQRDGGKAALSRPADPLAEHDEEHQRGNAGDHLGHDQRRRDHAGKQRAAAKAAKAGQGDPRHGAKDRGAGGRDQRDLQRQKQRRPDLPCSTAAFHTILVENPPQTVASRESLKE